MFTSPAAIAKGAGAIVVGAFLIWAFATHQRLKVAQAELKAEKLATETMKDRADVCQANYGVLQVALDEQTQAIREAASMGQAALEAQGQADRYARRLVAATEALAALRQEHEELRNRAVGLDVCQTYELVLRSFATEEP